MVQCLSQHAMEKFLGTAPGVQDNFMAWGGIRLTNMLLLYRRLQRMMIRRMRRKTIKSVKALTAQRLQKLSKTSERLLTRRRTKTKSGCAGRAASTSMAMAELKKLGLRRNEPLIPPHCFRQRTNASSTRISRDRPSNIDIEKYMRSFESDCYSECILGRLVGPDGG